jgi:hypothetical protein
MKRLLLIIIGVAVGGSTFTHTAAQTGDQAVRLARRAFEKSVEVRMADRRFKCMSAIGSPAFCDCLNAYLPLAVDFQTYIAVTTVGAHDQEASDDKKLTDLILSSRDMCVAKVFATPK